MILSLLMFVAFIVGLAMFLPIVIVTIIAIAIPSIAIFSTNLNFKWRGNSLVVVDKSITAFHKAAINNDIKGLKELMSKHDINIQTRDGRTALHEASARGNIEAINFLIKNGAKDMKNRLGNRALHLAARAGHTEAVEALYKKFKNIDPVNNEGHTPLHLAILRDRESRSRYEVIKKLLSLGASKTIRSDRGRSAKDLTRRASKQVQKLF